MLIFSEQAAFCVLPSRDLLVVTSQKGIQVSSLPVCDVTGKQSILTSISLSCVCGKNTECVLLSSTSNVVFFPLYKSVVLDV